MHAFNILQEGFIMLVGVCSLRFLFEASLISLSFYQGDTSGDYRKILLELCGGE